MRYIIGQASRFGEIPRRIVGTQSDGRSESHPERAINPFLVQQARELYIKYFGDNYGRQTGELDKLKVPVPLQSSVKLGLSADFPFPDFCHKWCKSYRTRCQYDCGRNGSEKV